MRVTKLTLGPYNNNVYVLADPQTGESVVIDASRSAGVVSKAIAKAVARHFELDDGPAQRKAAQ